ncbi:hypothetical protein TNCV_809851 [Trichonephila clavipes]|uniref:Uncharacterized protein n=1 Tax=Trichonephila clavipes TaxID=2585209 RepID=A0A8X6S6V5_TRICX|nr:hypothetical protein TNCV_809851 [Trichonephila clavipes]
MIENWVASIESLRNTAVFPYFHFNTMMMAAYGKPFYYVSSGFSSVWRDYQTTSRSSTRQGLLAVDLIILNHGQLTRTIHELAHLSPNYHTTPMGGHLSYHQCSASLHDGSSVVLGSNSRYAGLESVTLTTSLPRPPVTVQRRTLREV